MAFDFKKSLIKVQGGRQYLPVSARIVWFREQHPDWAIVTEPLEINHEKQYAIFRATVFNAEGKIMATGTKKEDVKGFGDYIEKSETGAVGRALALCGFGTQFSPELDEVGGDRLADSPQPMGGRYSSGGSGGSSYNNGGRYGEGRFSPAPAQSSRPYSPPLSVNDHDDSGPATTADPSLSADEGDDNPFGETDSPPAAAKNSSSAADPSVSTPLGCSSCGKTLTKAQHELSTRHYGVDLCPSCQREKPRTDRSAAAV